jgi:hypothetical protein
VPAHSQYELNELVRQFDISGFADVVLSGALGVPVEAKILPAVEKNGITTNKIAFVSFMKDGDAEMVVINTVEGGKDVKRTYVKESAKANM